MYVHKDSQLRSRPFHKAVLLGRVLSMSSAKNCFLRRPVLAYELPSQRSAFRSKISNMNWGLDCCYEAGGRIELTHSGALFLVEARKTLAQAQNLIDVAKRAERGEVGC
jgi:hypothetical protein